MFKIEFNPSIVPTLQHCLDRLSDLQSGHPQIWLRCPHVEQTTAIQALWGQLSPAQAPVRRLSGHLVSLSGKELRQLVKAMEVFIHVNDGRFCSVLNVLDDVISGHPNPFAVRQAFAQAEDAFQASGAHEQKEPLLELRLLATELKQIVELRLEGSFYEFSTTCKNARIAWAHAAPERIDASC
ncbi:hypothetical protein DV532_25420 (plasmid) [Pseudomonas sp. Leaf58]|uniref:hypothetical protein n=1 Tax=Pseudomonas sp. Leaf58 TaxID=1736226 RepID=UPI0006FF67FC|nr:hypothetical protein [Pseudomonas sp. Leaf58]AYG47640.1 hypothetical protein DV532_25420 [Pseudomonas sp. Leaf58]KQN62798.1 hypothetical protein ASF02_11680 [Pseudomonas sp. Leaf58]